MPTLIAITSEPSVAQGRMIAFGIIALLITAYLIDRKWHPRVVCPSCNEGRKSRSDIRTDAFGDCRRCKGVGHLPRKW